MMDGLKCRLQVAAIIVLMALLAGCMVGPNFHAPLAPRNKTYNATILPKRTAAVPGARGGQSQEFVFGKDVTAEWWTLFHSPELNALIQTGLANSPSLASAQAALRVAQETLYVQIGNSLIPAFNFAPSIERQRLASASFGGDIPTSIFNVFNASVNVSYTLDLFGGARRQIESLQAQVDYQQFLLIGTYLTLTTNIVTTAVTMASFQAQIDATRALINAEQKQLAILKQQYRLGGVSSVSVYNQETLVAQTSATLPALEKSLSQTRHALAVLLGMPTDQSLPRIKLDALRLPKQLPVSLPAVLVRQRPDVRAAEALFHSACALVGAATANLFPQFNLTGSMGWAGPTPSNLFRPTFYFWDYILQATQPIFHGTALLAARRESIAAYDQAAAQYRQTLLQAFQNVADSLRALDMDAKAFRSQHAAEAAAKKNLAVTSDQYAVGGLNYLNLLTAQQQYQQTRLSRIQAQALRYTDTAALFQALGGGWWNRHPAKCAKDAINPTHMSAAASSVKNRHV